MAKLKCVEHERRVMVISSENALHRSDDSKCSGFVLTMGKKLLTVDDVYYYGKREVRIKYS